MRKIKILLVEETAFVEIALQDRLNTLGFEVIDVIPSPILAIEYLSKNKVDIVLMDLFTSEKLNGNEAAKSISNQYSTPVILLNGDDKYNIQQIESSEAKLIMSKPLKDNELAFNIKAAINNNKSVTISNSNNQKQYIFVKSDYRLNKIRLSDIFYIEASKDYVSIHTTDNSYTVHVTMKDIEQALPMNQFVRTHRSYIVNIDKIFSIKYPEILIEQKMKIVQIGGLYRKKLMQIIDVL
ncbi:MAG: hypothetical protein B6I18_05235 [Bacteroidetes bacterium 4572_112]|nr:MAG: hypothetical protein B6I18_05235 [Bacteroidetes bacterium 4572_112]